MTLKIKKFLVANLAVFLSVLFISCHAENNDIPLRDLPLIDVHAHTLDRSPLEIINLARRENLEKVYIISKHYREHLPIIRANRDIARMLIMPDIKKKNGWKNLEPFVLKNRDVIAGVKLHPSMDQYIAGVDNLSDLFASAEKNHFVIVTHTDSSQFSSAENYRPLLKKFPNSRLILYHSSPLESALALIKEFPFVYSDISYTAYNKNWQRRILKEAGADKIVFGIDTPLGWPKDNAGNFKSHYRHVINSISPWYYSDRATMEKILYKNARKLFNEK